MKSKRFASRFLIYIAGTYICFLIIIGRLFYLQVPLGSFFYQKSSNNFTRMQTILPLRGNIVDRYGKILATNRPIINVFWQGTGNKGLSEQQHVILSTLEAMRGIPFEPHHMSQVRRAEWYKTACLLVADISSQHLAKLLEQFPACSNLMIENNFQRYYPYRHVASHLLGYINQIDQQPVGRMGLEELLQSQLQGEQGQRMLIINSVGTNITQRELRSPLIGHEVKTTLDIQLQLLAEQLFPEECLGVLLVMDPRNGALRTILSRPNFDPSMFLRSFGVQQWKEFQQGQPFLNRAFCACYPPASIFKLITMSAALEHDIIRQDDNIKCHGSMRCGTRRYHCANRYGHGLLTVKEALAKSCNILFFYIGKHLSIDTLADYACRFGLGSKTGVLFPEKTGLVPTKAWKRQVKGEPWWPGDNLSCAIGQSYLLATPIQIACMIGAIFEGMLVRPRILEQEPICCQPLNIKHTTRQFLQESMKSVAQEGTGQLVGRIKDIQIYAKTGTAETTSSKTTLDHTWFVAHFQYKDQEPLVLVIVVEHALAAKMATKIAKNYLIGYKKLVDNH